MQAILEIRDAVKVFGSGNAAIRALDGVSFTVEKGEFVAVMGASGSGKSTLLNAVSTIEPLTEGSILIDGVSVSAMKEKELAAFRRDKLGFIFQEYNLLDTLTIAENITLPLNLRKEGLKKTESALEKVVQTFGIEDQLKKFPYELSGGQRQRAACARAVICDPALILADEPTGALDSRNSVFLMKQFCIMNSTLGSTILMVTHDAAMAAYATRVMFLRDGKIFSELKRGGDTQKEFQNKIASVTNAFGEDENAV